MRSAVGGCVLKRLANCILRPARGLMMYAEACAGSIFIGVVFAGVGALIASLRAAVKRRQELGLLPGHQPPPTDE